MLTAQPMMVNSTTTNKSRSAGLNSTQQLEPVVTVEELASQLERLSENVANLQSAGDEFKQHQESLLDDIGQMKAYLELLVRNQRHLGLAHS